jgi:hypothetical protein
MIFIFSLFLSSLIVNYDFDLFARLEVGEIFWKLHTVLKHDPFSYTPTHYWYDHEWGSGVVFYAFFKLFGICGFVLLNSLLLTATVIFVLNNQHNNNTRSGLAFPLTAACVMLGFMHYVGGSLVRCQTFTFFLTALVLFILEKYDRDDSRLIWCLPGIIAIWCNLHGGVFSGLGIITLYCLTFIVRRKKVLKLSLVTVLSYLALFINPYGIKYFAYMYYTITIPRTYIYEWLSVFQPQLFMHYLPVILLFVVLISIKIYSGVKNKSFNITHYAVIAVTTYYALMHIKTLELAIIVLFAYTYWDINMLLEKVKIFKITEKCLYPVILISLAASILTINTPRVTFGKFPLTETEFLRINNIKGNIIVPFEMGSYISYKLYPQNLIFMDGRYDGVYSFKIFNDLMDFCNKREGWLKALNDYPTEIIMIETYDPAYFELKNNKDLGWEEIYTGYLCGLFVKKDNVKTSYLQPEYDINYYRNNIFKTNFIETMRGKHE